MQTVRFARGGSRDRTRVKGGCAGTALKKGKLRTEATERELGGVRMLPRAWKSVDGPKEAGKICTRKSRNGGYSTYMYPNENAEVAARKETQAFDPSLVDEEGIHRKQAAQDAKPVLLKEEQRDEEMDEEPSRSGGWQTFQTP
jgi:hypothetical protein